jgi:hypothetical protein
MMALLSRALSASSPSKCDGMQGAGRRPFVCKLKEFKRIAMRADKTDQSFSAMIYLTAAVVNSQ